MEDFRPLTVVPASWKPVAASGQVAMATGIGYGAQPSPHLSIDDDKSHDQCLRVYWGVDPASRTWTISSIGEHA